MIVHATDLLTAHYNQLYPSCAIAMTVFSSLTATVEIFPIVLIDVILAVIAFVLLLVIVATCLRMRRGSVK